MKITKIGLAVASLLWTVSAVASVEIRFVESAPKDRFEVTNASECDLRDVVLDIDLTDSRGQLIFDTTGEGPGVEVFQPFEKREGEMQLVSGTKVFDGDKSLSIRISHLPVNQSISFTIDVDDTLKDSALGQIRVTGSEIENGQVVLRAENAEPFNASFNANSQASVQSPVCGAS